MYPSVLVEQLETSSLHPSAGTVTWCLGLILVAPCAYAFPLDTAAKTGAGRDGASQLSAVQSTAKGGRRGDRTGLPAHTA